MSCFIQRQWFGPRAVNVPSTGASDPGEFARRSVDLTKPAEQEKLSLCCVTASPLAGGQSISVSSAVSPF